VNKFKEFRQARGYTQEDVAGMLKTTQQTVARWEAGRAEPNLAALRDLAVIFGTSVDDLLGRNPLSQSAVTNSYFSLDDGEEHFWGHLGVLLPGEERSRWYPITLKQAIRIEAAIQGMSTDAPWLAVPTLNNRMLVINVSHVHRICTLDDNADAPEDDWELGWDSYQGHSPEVYRALANWAMQMPDADEDESSAAFREGMEELVKAEELTDELVFDRIINTHVHFSNGQVRHSTPDADRLLAVLVQAEEATAELVFDLSEAESGLVSYVPANAARMLDMPLYQIIDAAKMQEEEIELASAAAEAEAAVAKAQQAVAPKKTGRHTKR
jgi:transcriptional regulator with XRE-family HTH domain